MAKSALWLLLLGALGCDPNVVDAVREPPMVVDPVPVSPLATSLIHRYSFNGEGIVALDSKGAAHGQILGGAELTGTGSLTLSGGHSLQYVNLPNGIVSGLTNATFEAWLTWAGGGAWQRIFDFGNSVGGEDTPTASASGGSYAGTSYLFLTTNASSDTSRGPSGLRIARSQTGVGEEELCYDAGHPFPTGIPSHVAAVVDHDSLSVALYLDGKLVSECPLTRSLSSIDDQNNWLGRSNFTADPELAADYDEFRIYGAVLSAEQLADSFKRGPDAEP
jgi:Concanavalin A-like lectin/glucanases superfamily